MQVTVVHSLVKATASNKDAVKTSIGGIAAGAGTNLALALHQVRYGHNVSKLAMTRYRSLKPACVRMRYSSIRLCL